MVQRGGEVVLRAEHVAGGGGLAEGFARGEHGAEEGGGFRVFPLFGEGGAEAIFQPEGAVGCRVRAGGLAEGLTGEI